MAKQDLSFYRNAAPKQPEPEPVKQAPSMVNVVIPVDANCQLLCDGVLINTLNAGVSKVQIVPGNHYLQFVSQENPSLKVEKLINIPLTDQNHILDKIEFSALIAASMPKEPEITGLANVTIRVDADSLMQCDGEFVDSLKAGMMFKTQLPVGQHLLEFLSDENPNVKVEKIVEWPESDKNYLVIVNEFKAKMPPPMPQMGQQQMPQRNSALDRLNQMAQMNPFATSQVPPLPGAIPPPMPGAAPSMPPTPPPFNNDNK